MKISKLIFICVLLFVPEPVPAWKADTVKVWATTLGEELWKLSEALTKSDLMKLKYKQMNASVKKKDGKQILESSLRSVSTMLTRKINAVKCIRAAAESLARSFNYTDNETSSFEYCSAKYSQFMYENLSEGPPETKVEIDTPKYVIDARDLYMNVSLEKDTHFYNISVNTNTSCVHVPTNIYDKENDTFDAIMWSRGLNDVFAKNYKSDPSLSWQYFGSSHGILRFYPGMPWTNQDTDTYDCRVQSWYIEAATCSKDMIILFDVSGSMTGFKNYVARRTLQSILDTLSNNDYVNVYTFKNVTDLVVQCFVGPDNQQTLVQATRENLNTIMETITPTDNGKKHKVPLEGYANLTTAYIKAFTTLKQKRTEGRCDVSSTQGCNQLVMVITDYVPGNLTEVFETYNREVVDNKTYIPVRVFTYLIGKEVTNVREIQWMACLNRGYFVHIHSVEEVQQQVLKHIQVIARPMILEKEEPVPTWTHANMDSTRTSSWAVSDDVHKPDEDKLVTSVAIPAFDYKYNEEHNDARLLGVAGTDVPIDSIAKLAQPNQLGVNGYSFIVSNNGYLLLHPLLITSINGKLQTNYNSVDFVEVEQVDDEKGSRELGEKIIKLRENLVNGVHDDMRQVEVLYHYDNMRRISRVKHDYFFNKLEGTPFSMGISLPTIYGDTELTLTNNPLEAKQGKELTGINVTDYFRFSYRIHPDWVYCKYHYQEGHESPNSEVEVWGFLVGLSKNEIDITIQQYPQQNETKAFSVETHCGTTPLDENAYYCNKELVEQLAFDAKLTTPYYETWTATSEQWDLAKRYNVSVRFVATASGLTRWHYIFDSSKNEQVDDQGYRKKEYSGDVFGDFYHNAIEETWYQAAVLQHMINNASLVVATALPILDDVIEKKPKVINEDGDITVTASFAIFYKDGNYSTPASVVGFQFSYLKFYERFLHITNITLDGSDDPTCSSDKYECYIIDSSGYIVLSKDKEQVGQFFGRVQKHVLQSFLDAGIFGHVEVFNYQALCPVSARIHQRAWSIISPFNIVYNLFSWLITEALIIISNVYNWNEYYAYSSILDDPDYIDHFNEVMYTEAPTTAPPFVQDNKTNTRKEKEDKKEALFSCDHSVQLYILNQAYFSETSGSSPTVSKDEPGPCYPPYWAAYISYTNTLLVVIENGHDFDSDCIEPRDTKPTPTPSSTSSREPCHKLPLGRLTRRRLEGCYTYHDGEQNITECGIGSIARCDFLAVLVACCLLVLSKLSFL